MGFRFFFCLFFCCFFWGSTVAYTGERVKDTYQEVLAYAPLHKLLYAYFVIGILLYYISFKGIIFSCKIIVSAILLENSLHDNWLYILSLFWLYILQTNIYHSIHS